MKFDIDIDSKYCAVIYNDSGCGPHCPAASMSKGSCRKFRKELKRVDYYFSRLKECIEAEKQEASHEI